MDAIQLTGIRGYGRTGVLPEERVLGQWFEVDLRLELDVTLAGESDRLEDTFDYRAAIALVKELLTSSSFFLVEKLATVIAKDVLNLDDRLQQVQVKLTKLAAPIPDFSGQVAIIITRTRTDI